MVNMFSLNQAALLVIQLSVMSQVLAVLEILQGDHRNILVSKGESVVFNCNTSEANMTQIYWKKVNGNKGRSIFTYSIAINQTFSNMTSDRLRIHGNLPLKLIIFNAQRDNAGLYTCTTYGRAGPRTIEWNLTVTEEPEEIVSSWYFPFILTSVIGVLLCGFTSAVCLCRKLRARTPNQSPVQDQSHLESGGEVVVPQPRGGTDRRPNNKRRSQYMERLNSIYDVY